MSLSRFCENDVGMQGAALKRLAHALAPQEHQLLEHRLYECLTTIAGLRVFMEHHAFAVWDFMALLKSLQRHLTCTQSLWRPVGNASSRRLINEMVLEEESDEINGVPTSHFEVYVQAMRQVGADTRPIEAFLAEIANGTSIETAFARAHVPIAARAFVRTTFDAIESGKPHVMCAAFTFGREQAIPGIFQAVLGAIPGLSNQSSTLSMYLERHIELDGQNHGPKALAMLASLCREDTRKWQEAELGARHALIARIDLWSCIARDVVDATSGCPASDGTSGFHPPANTLMPVRVGERAAA